MSIEIKEIKKYQIGEKVFDTKEQAEAHLQDLNNTEILIVYTGPDLTEGRYSYSKQEIFTVLKENKNDLMTGQTMNTLKKLAELALLKRMPKYDGIAGTIQLMDNFRVNVGTREELKDLVLYASEDKNVVVVEHKKMIKLSKIPYTINEAIKYVADYVNIDL